MSALDCARVHELLSDRHEETLDAVMRADVEEHLQSCAACRELALALAEVMTLLQKAPVLEPAKDLAERAASAALAAGRVGRMARLLPGRFVAGATAIPSHVYVLAAALTLVAWAGALVASGQGTVPAPRRVVTRVVNTGVYLMEKKDRVVEDIHILRVVIGTAFEGRLDRVNDRVDDYRRLMERRRLQEQQGQANQGKGSKAELPLRAPSPDTAQI